MSATFPPPSPFDSVPRPSSLLPSIADPRWKRVVIYRLQLLGDAPLTEVCAPFGIKRDAVHLSSLVAAMADVVDRFKGWGLAANQVGAAVRVIVTNGGKPSTGALQVMINPRITGRSFDKRHLVEGCLSVPKFETRKLRHNSVTVEYLDDTFTECKETLAGAPAQIIQHELEHLDGLTLVHGLSERKRAAAEALVAKARASIGL